MTPGLPAAARRRQLQRDRRQLANGPLPVHVGVVMDGNRRWARAARHREVSVGHRFGAEHLGDFLGWCESWDLRHVSAYVLSADNIRRRASTEIDYLFELLRTTIPDIVARPGMEWTLHVSGDRDLLPDPVRLALRTAESDTRGRLRHVTLAIGYDGRRDVVDGIRTALRHAPDGRIDAAAISAGLSGGLVKDIDLVIRTSGERRLSGFFPWQSVHAEIYVSRKMWPAFTERDFARALAHFAAARA